MARNIQEFRIFLASPGDVQTERTSVRKVAEEINRTLGNSRGFVLKVVGWDTDSRPSYGTDPQDWINESIGKMAEYDLFVGILWKRFGTNTPRADSGTEEEFNRAAEAHDSQGQPEIMLYAGQMPYNPSNKQDLEQKGKVLDFLDRIKPKAMYGTYDAPAQFEEKFRLHLQNWVLGRLEENPPAPPRTTPVEPASSHPTGSSPASGSEPEVVTPISQEAAVPTPSGGDWVLLAEHFFLSQSVSEKGNETIVFELLPQDTEEDAALRELQRAIQRGYNNPPVPFAHGNDGGIAKIESAESKSTEGKKVWTFTLKIQQTSSSPIGEAVINGVTPDQAAELRAKVLLLDAPLPVNESRFGHADMMTRMLLAPMKEKQGIFPGFWNRFRDKPALFLPLARLWAIYILRTSNICEHVLELSLKLVDNNQALDVVFRGNRPRVYSSRPPSLISISGRCPLTKS